MHYKYFRFDIDPKRVPNFPDIQDQIEVSNHPAMTSDNSNIVYIPGNNSKKISWLKFRSNEQQTGCASLFSTIRKQYGLLHFTRIVVSDVVLDRMNVVSYPSLRTFGQDEHVLSKWPWFSQISILCRVYSFTTSSYCNGSPKKKRGEAQGLRISSLFNWLILLISDALIGGKRYFHDICTKKTDLLRCVFLLW